MEPDGEQASQDMGGLTHSVRPGVPCPDTVLVVMLNDGSYLLVGYPVGAPAAFVTTEDADLLRQGLDGAFGQRNNIMGTGKARL